MPSYNTRMWAGDANYYGAKYGIPPSIILGIIHQQSGGNKYAHNTTPTPAGPTNAQGLGQFEPAAWAKYGGGASPYSGKANVRAIARYLAASKKAYGGNLANAYGISYAGWGGTGQSGNVNASEASWQSLINSAKKYGAVPAAVENQQVAYQGRRGVASPKYTYEYYRGRVIRVLRGTGAVVTSTATGRNTAPSGNVSPIQTAIMNLNQTEQAQGLGIQSSLFKVGWMVVALVLIIIGLLVLVWTPGTKAIGMAAKAGVI